MAVNTVQMLRDEIEDGIVAGTFRPGVRLDEMQLATRFGVSRTPVREALMQLGAIGFVEIRPRRGAIVVEIGPQRLYEMFEVMAELEGLAGALAARRHSEMDRDAIRHAHARCERSAASGQTDTYYYDNEVFHRAIYAASHSGFLEEQCITLHRRLRPCRRLQLRVRNRVSISYSEHAGVVDAILSGDVETAAMRLRKHVLVQGDRFSDLVASMKLASQAPMSSEQKIS